MITKLKSNSKCENMQTPKIDVIQTTCIFPNGQANTTPWRGELQKEGNTLPKGVLCCPTIFVEWLMNQYARIELSP